MPGSSSFCLLHVEFLKPEFGVNVISMVTWQNFVFLYDFRSVLLFKHIEAAIVKK